MPMKAIGLVLAIWLIPLGLSAQTAGNPVRTVPKGQWTVGLAGNYLNQNMQTSTAVSKRVFVKSMWGVDSWLGVYGMLGAVQLSMNVKQAGVKDYKDRFRFGYGAGVHWHFPIPAQSEYGPGLWGGVQGLKFLSEATFTRPIQFQGGSLNREFAVRYDWGEMLASGGIEFPVRSVRLYFGGAAWAIRRLDTKKEYLVDGTHDKQYLGKAKGEYRSGFWSGGVVGVEITFPQNYSISIEALGFNEENYQIMVGICQTGSPEW